MTRQAEQDIKAFINEALLFDHLLNCVPHDDALTPEEREQLLGYKPFAEACVAFAHTLRRTIWKEWDRQRQAERKRKRTTQKQRHERKPKRTR